MEAIVPALANQGNATEGDAEADLKSKADEVEKGAKKDAKDKKKAAEAAMTKKQRKQMAQMKIFDLKMQVKRPDLVEAWDVTTKDPLFLLECK